MYQLARLAYFLVLLPLCGGIALSQSSTHSPVSIFDRADLDADGKLSHDEFIHLNGNRPHTEQRFSRADANGDGVVSRDEFSVWNQRRRRHAAESASQARSKRKQATVAHPAHSNSGSRTSRSAPPAVVVASPHNRRPPNIVVILSDDQGYADVSFNPHHPPEVHTPHIDALARSGVVCTQGYATGHVCSPTRAGLMTGRYQQRFGVYTGGEGGSGVPLEEIFFPEYLKPAGYVSAAFGKWHLGLTPPYNPVRRGFDHFYGFMGRGSHDYFKLDDPEHPIYRDLNPIQDRGYLTDRITEEAVQFILRNKGRPFFAYVAYNAVHWPAQAPLEDIRPVTEDPLRNTLMAMLKHLDNGVGQIVDALKRSGVWENTLLFYLSDNGGARKMHACNAPLRGFKQEDYEGGVRVPFVVVWPSRLEGGTLCQVPVLSIDILPTALAAAGVRPLKPELLDGKNMLPVLTGESSGPLHQALYWSSGGREGKWAIRRGKWKLVVQKKEVELFDLEKDPSESRNLKDEFPEVVRELWEDHDRWLMQMAPPLSGGPKK